MLLASHQRGVVKKEQSYDVCNSYGRRRGRTNGALQYGYGYVPLSFSGNVGMRIGITNYVIMMYKSASRGDLTTCLLSENPVRVSWP